VVGRGVLGSAGPGALSVGFGSTVKEGFSDGFGFLEGLGSFDGLGSLECFGSFDGFGPFDGSPDSVGSGVHELVESIILVSIVNDNVRLDSKRADSEAVADISDVVAEASRLRVDDMVAVTTVELLADELSHDGSVPFPVPLKAGC